MTRVYLTISNVILNFITLKITILINLTKKALKIDKGIYIATIYKYTDTMYLIVGSFEMFIILIVISTAIVESSSPI